MRTKITLALATIGAFVLKAFALSTSASACTWMYYQPEEPKSLRD